MTAAHAIPYRYFINMDIVNYAQESKYNRLFFFCMCGLVLLSSGAVYLTQLAYQEIADTFSVSLLEVTYAFSLSTLAYAISFFIFGPLTNIFRTDKLLSFGSIGLVLCLVSVAICSTYQIFMAISLTLGIVASSVSSTVFSFVAKKLKRERGNTKNEHSYSCISNGDCLRSDRH